MAFKLLKSKYSVVKSFVYRGFLIEILDNAYFGGFRYEYRITALKTGVMTWCKHNQYRKIRRGEQFNDSSSMKSIKSSLWYAKDNVNGLRVPAFRLRLELALLHQH